MIPAAVGGDSDHFSTTVNTLLSWSIVLLGIGSSLSVFKICRERNTQALTKAATLGYLTLWGRFAHLQLDLEALR